SLNQRAERVRAIRAVRIGAKVMQRGQCACLRHCENGASAANTARVACSVQITVSPLGEDCIWITAVSSIESHKCGEVDLRSQRRRNSPNDNHSPHPSPPIHSHHRKPPCTNLRWLVGTGAYRSNREGKIVYSGAVERNYIVSDTDGQERAQVERRSRS